MFQRSKLPCCRLEYGTLANFLKLVSLPYNTCLMVRKFLTYVFKI